MALASHNETRALIKRYLDPGANWSSSYEGRMRGHVRECEDCAHEYDQAVVMHRLMVGGSADMPSGFERERMMASTVDAVLQTEKKATGWVFSWRYALGAAMAVLLVFVAFPQEQMRTAGGDNYFGVRGNLEPELRGGIGLSGVSESEQEYEVVQGESRAFLGDWLRIYTTRLDPELNYGFIFGIQKERVPIWYWPNPEDGESASQAVEVGVAVVIGGAEPFEFELSKRHHEGELQVVALFTTRPLKVEEVQKALLSKPANEALDTWLKEALKLESEEIIRILEVKISAGSKGLERP